MHYLFLILLASSPVFAQVKRTDALANPTKLEDFDHENKGCPENSECDETMGKMLQRWKSLTEKLGPDEMKPKAPAIIETFREKYGIPTEFYTVQNSQLGFKPVLYNSACKEHNPKDGTKILKGEAFLKGLNKDKATVVREDTVIEVPTSESLVIPQPVFVINEKTVTTYTLPINDQPLFIKDKELWILKEAEDIFYALKVSEKGEWKVAPLDLTNLSKWDDKRETVECPKVETGPRPKEFSIEFCKSIWNEDLKKTVIVKMHQGC